MKPFSIRRAIVFLLALLATPLAAESDPADQWLSIEQIDADLALAEEAYSRIHPGYTRYATTVEMAFAWSAIAAQAKAQGGMKLGEFYLALELALTNIRCDHTKAELPKALSEARKGKALYLPFRWELVEGHGLIEKAATATGLVAGDEIIAIDGRPLGEMVAEVSPYIPVDGYTEWSRTGGISQSLEFMGGALDHFGMLLWDNRSQARLTIGSADGTEREVTVDRISFEDWTALGEKSGANFKDAVRFERLGDSAGYLRIDTFVNYREPIDPHSLLGPVFEAMADEQRTTLVLDLRKNGGGSTDVSQALASYLLEHAMPLQLSMKVATLDLSGLKEHLSTWDTRALNPDPRGFIANDDGTYTLRDGILEDTQVIAPADAAFLGRLLVLVSDDNSSGSTNLLSIVAQQERATLIGEPTGGSAEGPTAGLLFTLTLPESGVRMRIPLFRYLNNVVSFEPGLGLIPDIETVTSVDDFRSGRDPALEKALKLVASPEVATTSAQKPLEQPTANAADLSPLTGDGWSGVLEYLNYGSDKRSVIPVRMFAREPGKRSLDYGILYPGEEHKNARDRLRISRDGRQINGHTIVDRKVREDGTMVFVTEGEGRDDNRLAMIRMTYEIAGDRFVVRKDVSFDGGEYLNRNEYRLAR